MIIGITGRKGSGKDTAAFVFEAAGYEKLKFAGALKEMIAALLEYQGVDEDLIFRMLEGDLKEVPTHYLGGRTPRHAMQTLGTEWGRKLMHEDLWVDVTMNAADGHEGVVISDVRFPNEVAAIKDRGGVIYRVERPGVDRSDEHPSEALIDTLEVDETLLNTAASAEEFQSQVYVLGFCPAFET